MRLSAKSVGFLVLAYALATQAQPAAEENPRKELRDFAVRTWTKADGLPDSSVSVILQTRDGYLWIGTGAGLVRFDSVRFVSVPLAPAADASSLVITALCEDRDGGLWIGSQRHGVYRWQSGGLQHFDLADGLLDKGVTSLTVDSEGQVWIGTRLGINRWNGKHLDAFTTKDGLPDNSVLSVHAAHSGAVWIATAAGVCRFSGGRFSRFHFPAAGEERDQEFLDVYEDRRGNLWAFCATYLINLAEGKRVNYFPGEKSAMTRIWSLCEGQGGRLWIGASGRGVFCFDGARFQPVSLNEGRWPNDVRTICEDHEGSLWLGISGVGLVQLRPQSFAFSTDNPGLPRGAVTCLVSDGQGRLIVGSEAGGVFVRKADRFAEMTDDTRCLSEELALTLCTTSDESVWIGTAGSGLRQIREGKAIALTTANGLSDDSVLAVCSDANGTVWVGTRSGALHRVAGGRAQKIATLEALSGKPITALLPTSGRLWVGTAEGTLWRSDDAFQTAMEVVLPPQLKGKAILGLGAATGHGLWIGTDGGGLAYLDEPLCHVWNTQDGLPDDIVSGMVEDEGSNLWLVTSRGLCRIARSAVQQWLDGSGPLTSKLVLAAESRTPSPIKFGGPRAVRAAQGKLWFALPDSLTQIDTRGWEANKPAPPVQIEAALANDEPLTLTPRTNVGRGRGEPSWLKLPARLSTLEFQFTALSFEAPEKVRFRHKLDGIDLDWVESGGERRARYGPLPPGHYTFHVTACNAEGLWNETGVSLAFLVPVPWWHAPWALTLGAMSLSTVGAGTVRVVSHRRLRRRLRGLEQQQAMERERMRIARNMHDDLGSKLTKLSFLSEIAKGEMGDNGRVESKIDAIAATSRELLKTLDEIVWAVNPHNDTLEHLAAYLCQYAREYFQYTAVECDLHVPGKLPQVEMSAETRHNLFLAFEESLNNILKHSGASQLRLDITAEAGCLLITIRDNGHGFTLPVEAPGIAAEGPRRSGNGLHNMRQRLQDCGGQCVIESNPSQGTCVSLSMPLGSAKMHHP